MAEETITTTHTQDELKSVDTLDEKGQGNGDDNKKIIERVIKELAVTFNASLVATGLAAIYAISVPSHIGLMIRVVNEQLVVTLTEVSRMAIFWSIFPYVFSGLMWAFAIEELIRYHIGGNHQTWNETAKTILQDLIEAHLNGDQEGKDSEEEKVFEGPKSSFLEAQKELNRDDIYFAKPNQRYNFIRFVITGAAFATMLGLYVSPFAAVAVGLVVLLVCLRYGQEIHKINHGETHLHRALKIVEKAHKTEEKKNSLQEDGLEQAKAALDSGRPRWCGLFWPSNKEILSVYQKQNESQQAVTIS